MPRQPVALILTRQALPTYDRKRFASASGLAQGAYVLADAEGGNPDVMLMATGSEVSLCVEAYEELKRQGIRARVVSMPSWELFERQSEEYRRTVLPPSVQGSRGGRTGIHVRMVPLCGYRRGDFRNEDIRSFGAVEGVAKGIWIHN